MATQIKIEFKPDGFEQILTSSGTMGAVQNAAASIQARANANNTRGGKGFLAGSRTGRAYGEQRALGFVYSSDMKSRLAESEDKALSRAVR